MVTPAVVTPAVVVETAGVAAIKGPMRRHYVTMLVSTLIAALVGLSGCASETESRGSFTHPDSANPVVFATSGERHCDRMSITYLDIAGVRYASDPQGLIPQEWLSGSYEGSATLPDDATDSGYRADGGDNHIWFAGDSESIYVGRPGSMERWPKVIAGYGCD